MKDSLMPRTSLFHIQNKHKDVYFPNHLYASVHSYIIHDFSAGIRPVMISPILLPLSFLFPSIVK